MWPGERSDGGQPGPQYRCLSVIRSGSVVLQRDSPLNPGLEISCPLSPPSHSGALCCWWQLVDLYSVVMWLSSFAAFFCPPLLSPPPPAPWQHCSNWKDKQFYQSRKLDGDVKQFHFFLKCVIHYLWYSTLKLLRADPTGLQIIEIGRTSRAENQLGSMNTKSTNTAFLFSNFSGWCTKMASMVQRSM